MLRHRKRFVTPVARFCRGSPIYTVKMNRSPAIGTVFRPKKAFPNPPFGNEAENGRKRVADEFLYGARLTMTRKKLRVSPGPGAGYGTLTIWFTPSSARTVGSALACQVSSVELNCGV